MWEEIFKLLYLIIQLLALLLVAGWFADNLVKPRIEKRRNDR